MDRWLWVPGVIWVLWIAGSYLFPSAPFSILHWSAPAFLFFRLAWYGTGLLAQIYRYRRAATPSQRQQTKWVVFGMLIAVLTFFGFRLPPLVVPVLAVPGPVHVLYDLIQLAVFNASLWLVPFGIGFSMLRYRLWEVDLLIRRTLVYSALTGALALVYFGSVTLVGALLQPLIGVQSPLALVSATLATAALVQPLRQRLQAFIDRRFYRRQYDAAQVVNALSATLRDEVDLARLTASLVAIVDETMRPAHISLWLRELPPHQPERPPEL